MTSLRPLIRLSKKARINPRLKNQLINEKFPTSTNWSLMTMDLHRSISTIRTSLKCPVEKAKEQNREIKTRSEAVEIRTRKFK